MPITDEHAEMLHLLIDGYRKKDRDVQDMFNAIRNFAVYDDEDAMLEAKSWVDQGFTTTEACEWISQGCFDALCAVYMEEVGITPIEAGIPYDYNYDEVFNSETIGYKYCNGEITLQEAIDRIHPKGQSGDLQ